MGLGGGVKRGREDSEHAPFVSALGLLYYRYAGSLLLRSGMHHVAQRGPCRRIPGCVAFR